MPTSVTTQAYNKASFALKKKYEEEYYKFRDSDACWGITYAQRHAFAVRHLRFKHPRTFQKFYKEFLEQLRKGA